MEDWEQDIIKEIIEHGNIKNMILVDYREFSQNYLVIVKYKDGSIMPLLRYNAYSMIDSNTAINSVIGIVYGLSLAMGKPEILNKEDVQFTDRAKKAYRKEISQEIFYHHQSEIVS